jgi:hypothetical protein
MAVTEFIILVPALIAIWYIWQKSYQEAFISIYLFTVLLLPGWCRLILPGLPKPSFDEAAIIPIAVAWLFKRDKKWNFSLTDALVIGLLFIMGYSEYRNEGFPAMRNQSVDLILGSLFPYLLGKAIIQPFGLTARFARKFVWYLTLVFLTTLYEFKFAYSPYKLIFAPLFPGQGEGWVTTFRYGFPRVAGPYGHAILAGLIFMIALSLQLWLKDSNLWERHFKRPVFHLKKAKVLTWAMFLGLTITFVRGPQIGMLISWILRWAGKGKQPKKRVLLLLAAVLIIGTPIAVWFYSYVSVGRAGAHSLSQESATYRKELIDKYEAIALQHAAFGWGINGWPKIASMPSIDNYYLLLSLMHGVIATALLLTIMLSLLVRLYRNGMKYAPMSPPGSSLSFTLLGIYAGIMFSVATVYIGGNVLPLFYVLTGFTDAYLLAGGDKTLIKPKVVRMVPARTRKMPRVVA